MTASLVDLDRERARRGRSNEPWISKSELAAHLGVSERTIARYLNDPRYLIGGQRIPHRRVFGGPVRFQISVVERFLDGDLA